MSTQRNQITYGLLWGGLAFAAGLLATYILTPPDLVDVERWKTAAWLYLNANGVPIAGIRVLGLSGFGQNVDLISTTGQFNGLRVLPPLLVTLGAVLTADSLPYTTRLKYIIENAAGVAVGYIGAALVTILVSGARPAVAIVILLGGVLGGALVIGSRVANSLAGLPVLGVTTLGGLTLIGIAVIIGGITVVNALLPLLAVTAGGGLASVLLLSIVRNL